MVVLGRGDTMEVKGMATGGRSTMMSGLDPDGQARFAGISPGSVDVWAFAAGYAAGSSIVLVTAGENTTALALSPGIDLVGIVKDRATGSPMEGADLHLVHRGPQAVGEPSIPSISTGSWNSDVLSNSLGALSATSDSEGEFSLVVHANEYPDFEVRAHAEGYAMVWAPIPRQLGLLEILLPPLAEEVKVKGRVLDLEGRPIEGALLRANVGAVSSDADGRFELSLRGGLNMVRVHA